MERRRASRLDRTPLLTPLVKKGNLTKSEVWGEGKKEGTVGILYVLVILVGLWTTWRPYPIVAAVVATICSSSTRSSGGTRRRRHSYSSIVR